MACLGLTGKADPLLPAYWDLGLTPHRWQSLLIKGRMEEAEELTPAHSRTDGEKLMPLARILTAPTAVSLHHSASLTMPH